MGFFSSFYLLNVLLIFSHFVSSSIHFSHNLPFHNFVFISTVSHSLVIGALHLGGGGGDGGTNSSIVHTRSSIGNLKLISLPLIVSISKLFSPASANHWFCCMGNLINGWMNGIKRNERKKKRIALVGFKIITKLKWTEKKCFFFCWVQFKFALCTYKTCLCVSKIELNFNGIGWCMWCTVQ